MKLKNKHTFIFSIVTLIALALLIAFYLFEIAKVLIHGLAPDKMITPVCMIILLSICASTFFEKEK